MQSSPAPRCHHIRTNGVRCGSLALSGHRYCYFHQRSRPLIVNFNAADYQPSLMSLPLFEDAHGIQSTLHSVVFRLLDRKIDSKTAGLILYALQIASSNLKHMKAETPAPDDVVTDLPKLSETPAPEPGEETARINSHTLRRMHFPYTPTTKDEYYDDVMRQQREIRENPEDPSNALFSPDLPPNLEKAATAIEGDYHEQTMEKERQAKREEQSKNVWSNGKPSENMPPATQTPENMNTGNQPAENNRQGNSEKDKASADGPPPTLPPGTIHGCAEPELLRTGTSGADD